jgi:hypothetical protein
MSASEELSFKIGLFDKDFLLFTGVPSHRLEEEVVKKITKCKGEYLPEQKAFKIPHGELCNLLDECFDYFTEESLLEIAALLDKSGADASTKERVREKSVSKSHHRHAKEKPKEEKMKRIEEEKPKRVEEEKPKRVEEDRLKRMEEDRLKRMEAEKPKRVDEDKLKWMEADRKRREAERKNKELEERLMEFQRRRENERRELIREQDRRMEEERRREEQDGSRLKASPSRFRAPESMFQAKESVFQAKGVRKVNFDSGDDEFRREVLGMMNHLRAGMVEMKSNMSRLEQMISKKF